MPAFGILWRTHEGEFVQISQGPSPRASRSFKHARNPSWLTRSSHDQDMARGRDRRQALRSSGLTTPSRSKTTLGVRRLPLSMTVSQILSAGDPPLRPDARDTLLRPEGKTARNAGFVERSEDLRRAPQFDQIAAIGFLVLYLP